MMKSVTKHREFKGPTPHSVAIFARPTNTRPAEHLILERRRIEDLREKSITDTKFNKQQFLRSQWERSTDKQIHKNTVKKEMEKHFTYGHMVLEKRRERLREMLLNEEDQYITEMESMEETTEVRQQKMKERAKYLKEKHEQERLAYVAVKIEQKFRDECEELRSEFSKQTRDEIFKDREEQIRMREETKLRNQEIEKFYADIWESDRLAKSEREELETKEQIERNRSVLEILNLQSKATETQRIEEKQVKEMEAGWLKKEVELRAYEEELLKKEKKGKQHAAKRARDISIKLKEKKEAKEKQEEIAMDMKMLGKILEDTQNQAVEDINKKKHKREEMQRFMHYVEKTRTEDEVKEKEVERLINDDVEQQWKKKDSRKRLEKEARKTLMQSVLQTREIQKKERGDILRREQESAMKERKELINQMEEHRRLENERIARIRQENLQYQNDLEEQIKYQRLLKEKEIDKARKELNTIHNTEYMYQQRLRSALANPDRKKQHPLRIVGEKALPSRVQTC